MRSGSAGVLAALGSAAICLTTLAGTAPSASAAPAGAVSFADAHFSGFATGTEVHLGAVKSGTTTLASVDQAFSGSSTGTSGLTTSITSETGNVVQPTIAASPAVNSYGRGSGLEIGAGTSSTATNQDPNQVTLAGLAQQSAAPNRALVTKSIGPLSLSPVATANAADGRADAVWSSDVCPLGQPLAFGSGNLADAGVLSLPGTSSSVLESGGSGVASTDSYNYLSSNGDGTFGLSSESTETLVPLSVNLLGLLTVDVTIAGANPSEPVTLVSTATGESAGGSVQLQNAGLLTVTLQAAGGAPETIERIDLAGGSKVGSGGFLHVNLSTQGLDMGNLTGALTAALQGNAVTNNLANLFAPGGALNGVVTTAGNNYKTVAAKLPNISLGSIDIDAVPHAIGGAYYTSPTVNGGTQASGAIDLVNLNLGLSASTLGIQLLPNAVSSINIANLRVGHLESSASLQAPINCTLPVVKSADPIAVTAGQSFTYTILVPDPADQGLIDCNLDNMTVTDDITDYRGSPTFAVTGATDVQTGAAGTIDSISPNHATVTWTGLNYPVAAPGQTPTPPIELQIKVTVPPTSPSGVIMDVVTAQATATGCNGGASGVVNLGVPSSGVALTGNFTLNQPSVTAGPTTSPGSPPSTVGRLAFTGATGGLWQPTAGVIGLVLGSGALAVLRRARRVAGR